MSLGNSKPPPLGDQIGVADGWMSDSGLGEKIVFERSSRIQRSPVKVPSSESATGVVPRPPGTASEVQCEQQSVRAGSATVMSLKKRVDELYEFVKVRHNVHQAIKASVIAIKSDVLAVLRKQQVLCDRAEKAEKALVMEKMVKGTPDQRMKKRDRGTPDEEEEVVKKKKGEVDDEDSDWLVVQKKNKKRSEKKKEEDVESEKEEEEEKKKEKKKEEEEKRKEKKKEEEEKKKEKKKEEEEKKKEKKKEEEEKKKEKKKAEEEKKKEEEEKKKEEEEKKKEEEEKKKEKKKEELKKPRQRNKGDALVIAASEGTTYAELLRQVRSDPGLKELGEKVVKTRRTQKGEMLFELTKDPTVSSVAFKQLVERSLGEKAKVRALSQETVIECRDLDEVTTVGELKEALTAQCGFEEPAVIRMRKAYGGTQIATIRVSSLAANQLLEKEKVWGV